MLRRRVSMADRADSSQPRVSPGFIALVSHEWNDQWLGRAQVMSRIAKQFHVVWCGPPHEWRAIPKRARSGPSVHHPVDDLPMLHTYRPEPWLPRLYRPRTLALKREQVSARFQFGLSLTKLRQSSSKPRECLDPLTSSR